MTFEITEYIPTVMPGVYDGVCTNIETVPPKGVNTEYRRWQFTLLDGRTVPGSSSMQTTPGSKGGKWAAALANGGVPLPVGAKPVLIGQPCTLLVELNDNGYEKVANVLPRQAAPAGRQAAQLAEDTDKAERIHAAQEDPADALPF